MQKEFPSSKERGLSQKTKETKEHDTDKLYTF